MLKIGICDDQQKSIDRLEGLIEDYFNARTQKIDYSIESFNNANDILDSIIKNGGFDILFLDVYMPFMLGTELAKQIRRMGDRSRIIFLTTSKAHAIDAFAVRASDYILKPASGVRLASILDEIILQFDCQERKTLAIKTAEGVISIRTKDISYVELCERRIRANLMDGTCVVSKVIRGTFENDIQELLDDDAFVQCQKSYVVNMDQILLMEKEQLKLRNGKSIPVSKRYSKQTKTRYMEYLLREDC